ncbi:hypothetical protein ILUMI_23110 [Ignelater luminosus]|uniref:Uncharacterized protein n=1 Tax=Ignelater luminosus TaxID=2038154 RepID=A0A8K0G269_IGNLU|nr:hypothetical protein ILUMI_23110 [Ignelater luminosus]
MQPSINKSPTSDDEEDLESLRLAALQSLKRQVQSTGNGSVPVQNIPKASCNTKTFGGSKNVIKRGRGFHGGGRPPRNAPYNRIRNTNLISVQTIEPEQPQDTAPDVSRNKKFVDDSVPKLVLPQDRYCNPKPICESKANEASSKFDRYNDSDKSESDSESEEDNAEIASPKKLERASSLEALMQELENEIQGDAKPVKLPVENVIKPKKIKKPRKSKPDMTDAVLVESDENVDKDASECKKVDDKVDIKSESKDITQNLSSLNKSPARQKSKSPLKHADMPNIRGSQERPLTNNSISQNLLVNSSVHNVPFLNSTTAVAPPVIPFQQIPYTNFSNPVGHMVPFDPSLSYNFAPTAPLGGVLNDVHSSPSQIFSPNRYERPISPLTIKTDILNTISAPLSPRSAAFVLQNREIVERRKKSPKRSFSRSPSPEFRRSLSPRYRRSNSRPSRSPSPVRLSRRSSPVRRLSPSNRKHSPNIRRISPSSQPSSRRNSPHSNRYRLTSPKRPTGGIRISPKRSRKSPQRTNIRNRLGNISQSNKPETSSPVNTEKERRTRKRSRSISLSLSPSPERFSCNNSPTSKEEDKVDSVLEARKRKFEGNGNIPTEGIIRLKPQVNRDEVSSSPKSNSDGQCSEPADTINEESLNDDELLGADDTYIDFNVKVDDLFSDEESDNENEGRFKSNRQQTSNDVTVMPFTQLMNGPVKNSKNESLSKDKQASHSWEKERRERNYFSKDDRNRGSTRNKSTPDRRDRDRNRIRATDSPRSRSPLGLQNRDTINDNKYNKGDGSLKDATKSNTENSEKGVSEKRIVKSSLSLKIDAKPDRRRQPIVSPIENKKIEIKIRNPSKYEVDNQNYAISNKGEEQTKDKKNNSRKVEVADDCLTNEMENSEDFNEPEPEIIIENEEEEGEDVINKTNKDTGDLRAQLSRKRAERQSKLPKLEGVSSRLLQNALQGAVFKKSKKSKSKKKSKEAAPLDGKLPIHLRLGVPGNTDVFTDSKVHKTSRKRIKNRGTFNQV